MPDSRSVGKADQCTDRAGDDRSPHQPCGCAAVSEVGHGDRADAREAHLAQRDVARVTDEWHQ